MPRRKKKSRRGFASMSPERRREIASRGGKSAQSSGHAYKFNRPALPQSEGFTNPFSDLKQLWNSITGRK